jgi:hypothetical protein
MHFALVYTHRDNEGYEYVCVCVCVRRHRFGEALASRPDV